jgi:hypothetical protein
MTATPIIVGIIYFEYEVGAAVTAGVVGVGGDGGGVVVVGVEGCVVGGGVVGVVVVVGVEGCVVGGAGGAGGPNICSFQPGFGTSATSVPHFSQYSFVTTCRYMNPSGGGSS